MSEKITEHFKNDRQYRYEFYKKIGIGQVVDEFEMDRHHPNGIEIHKITDNAFIKIYNKRTGKLITMLCATPGQIKRYYPKGQVPRDILNKAIEHTRLGYNIV